MRDHNYKFDSREAFLRWSATMVTDIKVAIVAQNEEHVKRAINEIDKCLHLAEHQGLYP